MAILNTVHDSMNIGGSMHVGCRLGREVFTLPTCMYIYTKYAQYMRLAVWESVETVLGRLWQCPVYRLGSPISSSAFFLAGSPPCCAADQKEEAGLLPHHLVAWRV